MSEYIEREALLGEDGLFVQRGCTGECAHCGLWSKEGCKVITEAPSADVVKVKHGRWVGRDFDHMWLRCSLCGKEAHGATTYCPNCGAKMDGE